MEINVNLPWPADTLLLFSVSNSPHRVLNSLCPSENKSGAVDIGVLITELKSSF